MKYPFKSHPPSLSLCMILKNEEKYLADCLKSVADIVNEIIIVDTGSTDATLEIAKKFNAKIHHLPWSDDFAAARNESLKYALCDWILYLDADERLLAESKQELRNWLNNAIATCVNVIIISPSEDGRKSHLSRSHRLFRNIPGIQFTGRIHEQISPSISKLNGQECFSNIKIKHLGYAKNAAEMLQKNVRNYKILRRQVEEEPNNAYWHYCLAQNLMLSKRYKDALISIKTALGIGELPKDIICSMYNNLAEIYMRSGNYETAIRHANKALTINPQQSTAYLILFQIYRFLGNQTMQIRCLEAVIDKIESKSINYQDISLEAYVDITTLYLNLARLYFVENDYEKAIDCYKKLLRIEPANVEIKKRLAALYYKTGSIENAKKYLAEIKLNASLTS